MTIRVKARVLTLALLPAISASQGTRASVETRGKVVEAHRSALQDRIQRLRATLLDTLRLAAPDLVGRLDPAPPPVAEGYQLLPRIVPDAPQPTDTVRRAALYSWPWTDTLIDRVSANVDSLLSRLRVEGKSRSACERLVSEFNQIAADRRLVDAHVEHNWFWQPAIAADTMRFARASAMITDALRGMKTPALPTPAMPRVRMMLDDGSPRRTTIRVPVVTDIEDTAFVRAVQAAIERLWTTRAGDREYRVALEVRFISPRELYCRSSPGPCSPPPPGTAIDVAAHVARFAPETAVLTTGGTQPHVLAGRAMILGPRDVTGRTLGHEFGHILGFDDAYLRGFRSLGADGFAIIELIPDRSDLMAASGFGATQIRHFEQVVDNLEADQAMKAGLQAMYEQKDAHVAALRFAEVLRHRPDHYGATFQLAKSLDQSGDSVAAVPVWKRMLEMARASGDSATAAVAIGRLRVP